MSRLAGLTITLALLTPSLLHADVAPLPFLRSRPPSPRPTAPTYPIRGTTRIVLTTSPPGDRQTHIILPGGAPKRVGQGASRPSVLIVGLALAGAFTLGGLWMVRTRTNRWAGGLGMLGALGVLILGVSGCPPFDRRDEREPFVRRVDPPTVLPSGLSGEALLERDPHSDVVRIQVDRELLAQFAEPAAEPQR
jgi:hypothetical protein